MNQTARIRVEPANRRIRAQVGGEFIVDTTNPLYVWEIPYYPTFYLPRADVKEGVLVDSGETKDSPSRGTAILYDIKLSDRTIERGAYAYPEPEIADHVVLVWDAMDHWFEEDEEVFVHARDPNTRVEILPSSRNVRVEIGGEVVAESTHARFLHESHLPVRYYLPKTDVRFDLLAPTDSATHCPYKGTARYWSATVNGTEYEDIVWGYDTPLKESADIGGMVSFYNEKVDIFIDDQHEERPKTKWS